MPGPAPGTAVGDGRSGPVTVQVNGESRVFREGTTVADLIDEMGVVQGRVAVELNEKVVPRAEHGQTILSEGDRVEVVAFMGGGAKENPDGNGNDRH